MAIKIHFKKPGLTVWILVVTIAAILGSSYIISWQTGGAAENEAKKSAGERLQQLAYQMSDKADRGIDERLSDVYAMMLSPTLNTPGSTIAAKQQVMMNIGKTYPQYSFAAVTDPNGKVLASKDNLLIGANVSARPWFKEAVKAKQGQLITEDVHTALLLAKLLPQNPNGEPLRFIDVAGPLYDTTGKLQGVVGVHLSFNWIDDIRNDLIQPNERRDKVQVSILGRDNTVLLGPGPKDATKPMDLAAAKDAMPGKNGYTIETWPDDGQRYLTGYFGSQGFDKFEGLGWKILVRQPVSVAFAAPAQEAESLRRSGIALGAITALVATFVVWRVLRREKKLEEAQLSFVSLASHQLRTPATAVKQQLGLIVEGYATQKKDIDNFVHKAYDSNLSQLAIIEDLLSVARMDSGKMELTKTRTNIVKLVDDVVEEQKASKKEGQHIRFEKPTKEVFANVDSTKVKMTVANFLSNAIKYTPEKGSISVSIRDEAKTIRISVTDTGVGISKHDQKKLFAKFSRVENPLSAKVQGTGLGLYLAKQIAVMHGGSVRVDSENGKGSTFILQLPKE